MAWHTRSSVAGRVASGCGRSRSARPIGPGHGVRHRHREARAAEARDQGGEAQAVHVEPRPSHQRARPEGVAEAEVLQPAAQVVVEVHPVQPEPVRRGHPAELREQRRQVLPPHVLQHHLAHHQVDRAVRDGGQHLRPAGQQGGVAARQHRAAVGRAGQVGHRHATRQGQAGGFLVGRGRGRRAVRRVGVPDAAEAHPGQHRRAQDHAAGAEFEQAARPSAEHGARPLHPQLRRVEQAAALQGGEGWLGDAQRTRAGPVQADPGQRQLRTELQPPRHRQAAGVARRHRHPPLRQPRPRPCPSRMSPRPRPREKP